MRSGYLLAGASILHAVTAIPAYITTVFDCPDAVTITQTVYPPGWAATGPIYPTYTQATQVYYPSGDPPATTCYETAPVTTSWETEWATTTVYYSELGMYSGPPGCPSEIIAYMPTTITCSEAKVTGWVGYTDDIACASCTATTLVGLEPSYGVTSSVTTTYVTVWTEIYYEGSTSTWGSVYGNQWIATGYTPTAVWPYPRQCTGGSGGWYPPSTPTYGGGYSYTHSQGAYPSIDYNNPQLFKGGQSIPIESSGYQQTYSPSPYPSPYPTPGNNEGPYTWTKGHYPSIDWNNSNYFHGGEGTGTYRNEYPPPTETWTGTGSPTVPPTVRPATATGRPTSYPYDFNDPNVFRPIQSSVGIDSATTQPPTLPPTATYTVPTSYTSNYNSVDAGAPENFRPLSTGITIVSFTGSQSNAPQTSTRSQSNAPQTSTRSQSNAPQTSTVTGNSPPPSTNAYPSINFADPNVFKGLDPNANNVPTAA